MFLAFKIIHIKITEFLPLKVKGDTTVNKLDMEVKLNLYFTKRYVKI